MGIEALTVGDYDYNLPYEQIAGFPLSQRDQSRLLVWNNGRISENIFQNISEYIPENALLVFNNTRVIPARLIFQKPSGAQIEIFCLEPDDPSDYALSLAQTQSCIWRSLIGNAKKWKGEKLHKEVAGTRFTAERLDAAGETHRVRFQWDNPALTFADMLETCGELPIPPYLHRKAEASDRETYQTVYAKIKGSVAAPTAGLHFTEAVFQSLKRKHIDLEELTLHVGAGTFKPVKSETLAGHVMHTEYFSVKKSTVEQLINKSGRVFAVGTTSVRSLESLYCIGEFLANNPNVNPEELNVSQWQAYGENAGRMPVDEALRNILNYLEHRKSDCLVAHTQILIAPGYDFKIVNGIITNFHQPKSTLLLLISAFVKGKWRDIYDYALAHGFRFLSYGDGSLLTFS
ncbi:MAG: S-adenosylmethionine:tRNA ribosyltransferase-isomerase [Dysgonamonadaceae bacterium]|jgi:S-adenosylmethionine:tRNA ribosyltransferase-isomerase|nr:S-adenosylmethionine:tRNA ribosyltransferase-isomerase [Dysgonamonadaceae bacterium]